VLVWRMSVVARNAGERDTMNLMAIVPRADGDTEIRIFRSHELRLTAWRNDVSATT
jgi:hypothetical protein